MSDESNPTKKLPEEDKNYEQLVELYENQKIELQKAALLVLTLTQALTTFNKMVTIFADACDRINKTKGSPPFEVARTIVEQSLKKALEESKTLPKMDIEKK